MEPNTPNREETEKQNEPRRRGRGVGTAAVFFAVLGLMTVAAWIIPLRPTVSQREKRELEKFPAFSLSALADGSYFAQIDRWFSDTFPGRDSWIEAAQNIERLHGSGNIVIYGQIDAGDDIPPAEELEAQATPRPTPAPVETVISAPNAAEPEETEPPVEEDEEPVWGGKVIEEEDLVTLGALIQIGDSAFSFTGFSQYYTDMYAESINKAAELLDGKARVFSVLALHSTTLLLPRDYRDSIGCKPEEEFIAYLNGQLTGNAYGVDTYNALLPHNGEYIYFRTDHHWTALGAYYAYVEWARVAGVEPVGLEEYEERIFEPFYGSLYYQANQSSKLRPDEVYAYVPPGDVHLYIELNGADSLDNRGYEQTLITEIAGIDKYLCFLTGDVPLATFVNNDITDGSACLIIKNSNGNPFCYYFTQHYQYVYVIDYRKYSRRSLTKFVDYYDVDDVIFCLSSGQIQSYGGNELLKGIIR